MKNSERKAWTEFVRKREQAAKGKKRERRSEQTPEPTAEDALDDLLREAVTKDRTVKGSAKWRKSPIRQT